MSVIDMSKCSSENEGRRRRTNFLRTHRRLIPQAILVDLDLAWHALPVQRWTDEDLRQLRRPSALDLDEGVLLDDIRHLLLLLFALVDFLFEICDLLRYGIKAITVY